MTSTLISAFLKDPIKCSFFGSDKDEKILLVIRRAFITNFDWILIALGMIFFPSVIAGILSALGQNPFNQLSAGTLISLSLFWTLVTFGFIFENFLNWFFNVNIITDKRVVDMDFQGLLHRNVSEAPLRNIEDVTYSTTGAAQFIFHYGDVNIQTAGEKREIEFHAIPHPAKVQDLLSDLVSSLRQHDNN